MKREKKRRWQGGKKEGKAEINKERRKAEGREEGENGEREERRKGKGEKEEKEEKEKKKENSASGEIKEAFLHLLLLESTEPG